MFIMEKLCNFNDVVFNHYFLVGGLLLSYLLYRIFVIILCENNFMQTKIRIRGHAWRSIQCNKSIPYNTHCTICGELMLPVAGVFCECCGVSACKNCRRAVNKKYKCKLVSWQSTKPFCHHWVNVGHIRNENSEHIDEGVQCYFCCWCQRTKRTIERVSDSEEECDFEMYKSMIIPPACVQLEKGTVKHIKSIEIEDWEPLIVLANRKSGSNRSDEVLSLFRGLLNPIQVVDISVHSPESVVRWLPARCRLLVAGGDGTVAWVLNALTTVPHVKAAVAILPMGTGNDLSRVLGWGPGCNSHLDAHTMIISVRDAVQQPLDRWKVTVKPKRLGRLRPDKVVFAYNYASIGVDAQVALDFERARAQFLYRYASRTLNYIAYAFLGGRRALDDGGCGNLERRLRVWCNGSRLPSLPPIQALVALNIPSWGAGVDLWSMGDEGEVEEQNINDGKLEVVGISSSIHIARLQCGLAEPYRFTQASHLKIELEGTCAMQVDGEPWMQGPATVFVEPDGQSLMLRANNITQ